MCQGKKNPVNEINVLKKRQDFLRVAAARKKWVSQTMVIQMRPSPAEISENTEESMLRVGYTASKKVGNAVMRNRAKRRLREIARTILPEYGLKDYDYVIIARDKVPSSPFEQLIRDFKWCLRRLQEPLSAKKEGKERASTLEQGQQK